MLLGPSREVMVRTGPGRLSLVVMFVLGCSSDSNSGSGCGTSSTQHCQINATATVCGDLITVECFDGAAPDATGQCQLALEQADDSIYCCTSAAPAAQPVTAGDGGGGSGGSGGAGT